MNNLYIEITNTCNLHCSFCPCGKPSTHEQDSCSFMPLDLFKKCIISAEKIGVNNIFFHVLGEPTLHPKFIDYTKELEKTPLKLTLTTNGTTINHVGSLILETKSLRQVNFSTHAYAELPHDKRKELVQSVLNFCKIASVIRPDLYVNLRLWNIGAKEADSWNNYVLSCINDVFNTNINPGHFCSRHKSFNIKGKIYLHEDTRFEWPNINKKITSIPKENKFIKGTCKALSTHIAILHDGRVVACCLDYSGQITLGNIQEQSLIEIMNSPLVKRLKEGFEKHELRHPFCQTCNYCKRFK